MVLSRFKVFAQLIDEEDSHQRLMAKVDSDKDKNKSTTTIKAESDTESTRTVTNDPFPAPSSNSRAIIIKVDKFPLATFCALLYYIYTDEIDLSIDTDRFVISVTEVGSFVWRDADGKIQDHHHHPVPNQWPPLDRDSSWKLKDVAWDELLGAADLYGVSELRTHCLMGALNELNEHNAVRLVFSCARDVKQMAMRYIVDNAEMFFERGKQDPFLTYKEHPDCHEVLVELMQMKAKKA